MVEQGKKNNKVKNNKKRKKNKQTSKHTNKQTYKQTARKEGHWVIKHCQKRGSLGIWWDIGRHSLTWNKQGN